MKPVMMAQDEAPQGREAPMQEDQGESEAMELPDDAMDLVNGIKAVLFDDGFVPAMEQAVAGAADFASAAALLCLSLIERGQKEMGTKFADNILYERGGVMDYVLTAIYAYGQGVKIPEASDQASYEKAAETVIQMAQQAVGGQSQGGMA